MPPETASIPYSKTISHYPLIMTYTVTFIGALNGTSIYREQDILLLLQTQPTDLHHGKTFTGRPGTQIYIDHDTVLKIRSEIHLEPFSAKRWATQALDKEKQFNVHHPQKTWFVAETDANSPALIGNICPRLQPLHELFSASTIDNSTRLRYLKHLFDHYFRLASQQKIRLDEGLSNFGVSSDQQLYYLDDDTYGWDRFISCAQILGVYFRSLPWLSVDVAAPFGQIVHQLILEHFQDPQYFRVLAEQLKDVYLPAPTQRQAIDKFINNLNTKPEPQPSVGFSHARYLAILADIHANFPALQAVLNYLKSQNIQQGIVLGDVVGYGPHPSQCIECLQASNLIILKGNHDHGLAIDNFKKGFSSSASWVLEWSSHRVTAEQKNWLADLPPLLHTEHWLAVHGAPIDPTFFNAYVYEMTYHDNLSVLKRKRIPVCFHGHTHHPGIYGQKKFIDSFYPPAAEVDLTELSYALVCPGSVGQPRDGKAGAQFAIYDQVERKLYFHHLAYDLAPLLQEMEAAGFPSSLINMVKGRL
jgi:predicted phosphodiesterase